LSDAALAAHGKNLFKKETFGGNGRTCGTCHLLHSNTDLTPADVAEAFQDNPAGPLFRSLDSNDGVGNDYSILLRDATVRIPFTLPPNVWVDEVGSPNVRVNADGTTTVFVRRSTPTVENIFFEDHLMWDGRFGADLELQAEAAVRTHDQPGRLPTAEEKKEIALFQRGLFSDDRLEDFAAGGAPPALPAGKTESQKRGRTFFVSSGPIDATHRGLCATCHSGPLLNTTNQFNPVQPPGMRISNNFVSETNMLLGHQYEELTYHAALPQNVTLPNGIVLIPAGTVVTLKSSDPGRLLTTGNPCELPAACLINPGSTVSFFKIPTLWGTAHTAPYFHDNSAATFEEVLDLYQVLFSVTAQGLNNPAFVISQQDREDIIAYMELAFR
jgi:cytochrome c peroxidase